jgi:hypothetical protein
MEFEVGGQESSTLTTTESLKKLAEYIGSGLWSISIADWEWQLDETTGEVTSLNEEAAKLLEEIALKTYHNSEYGYSIDYPPSWILEDDNKAEVFLSQKSGESVVAFIFVGVIEETQLATYGGLQAFMDGRLLQRQTSSFEFELTERTDTTMSYTWTIRQGDPTFEVKHYFVEQWSRLYELVAAATKRDYPPCSYLYDPYSSLRFDEGLPNSEDGQQSSPEVTQVLEKDVLSVVPETEYLYIPEEQDMQTLEFQLAAGNRVEGEVVILKGVQEPGGPPIYTALEDEEESLVFAFVKDPYGNKIVQSAWAMRSGELYDTKYSTQKWPWHFAFIAASAGEFALEVNAGSTSVYGVWFCKAHLKVTIYSN